MSAKLAPFFLSLPIFENHPRVAHAMARHARLVQYNRREVLWSEGEEVETVAWVRSGAVKEARRLPDGRELTLRFFRRGALLGEQAMIRGAQMRSELVAHEPVKLIEIPRREFLVVAESSPAFMRELMGLMESRRAQVEARMEGLLFHSATARLAGLLLELAEGFGIRDGRGTIVDLRLTHREIASMIGTTRETVSFAITDLRKEGVIQTERKRVVLLNRARLVDLAA